MVTACKSINQPGWLELRCQLWPHCPKEKHLSEMSSFLEAPQRFAQFVEYDETGLVLGFVEASLRNDYVNGTKSSPVVFLEGIFVTPQARMQGVARALVSSVEAWARNLGCSEFASDAQIDNTQSQKMHAALGFTESERVIFFKKVL